MLECQIFGPVLMLQLNLFHDFEDMIALLLAEFEVELTFLSIRRALWGADREAAGKGHTRCRWRDMKDNGGFEQWDD